MNWKGAVWKAEFWATPGFKRENLGYLWSVRGVDDLNVCVHGAPIADGGIEGCVGVGYAGLVKDRGATRPPKGGIPRITLNLIEVGCRL